ncbi:MAG: N-acetyltransferase [Chloroflexi bacterium]|nr:MAG: N-acetyltransferase [Chloroflexota bacterium]TME16676.1 MAG: N-acetyltransferase [Chloroflexota bacterium]
MQASAALIHARAEVADSARIGEGTRIWSGAQVREHASIGVDCVLGKGVYVDPHVTIGDRVKLENNVSIFRGAEIGSGVFIGPHTCLLNDKQPRATAPDGRLKTDADWIVSGVTVEEGASIGGGCTVLPGVRIGAHALVGAGAVVTRDVRPHAIVVGNPARQVGYACECAGRLAPDGSCTECGRAHDLGPGRDGQSG